MIKDLDKETKLEDHNEPINNKIDDVERNRLFDSDADIRSIKGNNISTDDMNPILPLSVTNR